jgi:hypothetical protein
MQIRQFNFICVEDAMNRRLFKPWRSAALAGVLLTGSVGNGATDDWMKVRGAPPPNMHCRTAESFAGNADARFDICWSGTNVWVSAKADDNTPGDQRGGAAQIKYLVEINKKWYEHKRLTAFDRNPTDNKPVESGWFVSRRPTKSLVGRACMSKEKRPNTVDPFTCDHWR